MDELSQFAENIMSEVGAENYNINIEGFVGKGENYTGEVLFFNITPKSNAKPLHFVRKKTKYIKNSKEREIVRKIYQRESFMYKVVFPEMKNFLRRHKLALSLDFIPKVYHILEEENQEMLIFENLQYSGYQMLDKKNPLKHERLCEALETLAKFHALSFAMKKLEPESFRKLSEGMTDVWRNFTPLLDAQDYFGEILKDVLDKLNQEGRGDLMLKFKPILDDIENVVYGEVETEDQLVLCHGDYWINNMLFKIKESESSSSSVCLIDFQISCLCTPVVDISALLFSACNSDILNNIEYYLRFYHDLLSGSLEKAGVDITDVFGFEILMKHWKKYAKTRLVIGISIIQTSFAEVEEIPDDLNSLTYTSLTEMKNADMFYERACDVLISFGDNFL